MSTVASLVEEVRANLRSAAPHRRPPGVLTIEDAAAQVDISPKALQRMIRRGLVVVCHRRRRRMVPISEIGRLRQKL